MKQSGFNPNARWDRHIPETSQSDDSLSLNEVIEVLAYFKNGKISPQIFIWNNKEYEIKAINYNWQEHCGREVISYFSVSTDPGIYQISFNNSTFGWRIDKIIS